MKNSVVLTLAVRYSINVEAQKDEPSGYQILNRAIFYVSVMCNLSQGIEEKDIAKRLEESLQILDDLEAFFCLVLGKSNFCSKQSIIWLNERNPENIENLSGLCYNSRISGWKGFCGKTGSEIPQDRRKHEDRTEDECKK